MKILVLSNNPLSLSNSNGRTLLNMLECFNNSEILNIYINGNDPALEKATFYKINETRILKNKKPYGKYFKENNNNSKSLITKKKKTPFKCLIRSYIWTKKSVYDEILNVAKSFGPGRIVLQCGDSDFIIKIACFLCEKLALKLIAYNSEDYIFKTWNYIEKKKNKSLFFKIFFKRLKRSYKLLYNTADSFVYLTSTLLNEYLESFPNHRGYVVYNSSNIKTIYNYCKTGPIVYSGNLGVGRADTLVQLSEYIYNIFNKKITICSLTKDIDVLGKISNCQFIDFIGELEYKDNIDLLEKSSLIIHVESMDDYYVKDTKNAFSTKIADSLFIGVPFFVLAPSPSSISNYIKDNDCAFIANNFIDAENLLRKIYNDENFRMSKLSNALKTATANHDSKRNSSVFYRIVVGNKKK